MKITVYFDHNGILRGLCGELVCDTFYDNLMPNELIDKAYKKSNRVEQTTTELIRELQKENFLLKLKK